MHVETAGVILAAGGSKRMGCPKQLLNWQGIPFIAQVAQNALEAGLKPLIVVTGADQELIEGTVRHLPVQFVNNPDWASGMSSSMKVGLRALPQHCDSVIFLLSDQPQISPLLIRQLLERYAKNRAPITAPMVGGRRGNPVLFGSTTFNALMQVQGDQGGRAVFSQYDVDWLPWVDDRILMDVDRIGDEQALWDAFS
ncbi:MAG: nucleotidyltransferase family protein, partial [Chloroflexota bacterium]|nr:nucleotidyltransferase family protein [Chloroflexota bacterium]